MKPVGVSASVRLRRRLFGLAALVVGMLALLPASSASAHAFLTQSSPADGSALASAPAELRLSFSESVVLEATTIDIVDSSGRHHRPSGLRFAPGTGAAGDTEQPAEVVADLPALGRDAYRISWHTLSSDDLHRTDGILVFGIGEQVTAAGLSEPAPGITESALRTAVFLSIALALGGLSAGRLFGRVRMRDLTAQWAGRRCRTVARWGAGAGVLTTGGLLADQLLAGGGSGASALSTGLVLRFALRDVGFLLLLVVSLLARAGRIRSVVALTGAAAVGIGTAMLGHSAAGSSLAVTRVIADAAHVVAAATWSGTLLLAIAVALPLRRAGHQLLTRNMLRAFGFPAFACVAAMMVSGLYLMSGVVGSVDAALLTGYGRTLLIKICVVGVIVALGIVNSRTLRRPGSGRVPGRTVVAEGLAAVVVFVLAAMLTSGQPAMEPQLIRTADGAVVPVIDAAVDDLQETLSVRPNLPGRNVVLVDAFQTRRPLRGRISEVLITFFDPDGRGSTALAAADLGDGKWSVSTDFQSSGGRNFSVTVRRAGLPDATWSARWTVGGGANSQHPVLISNAPIAGILQAASLVLLLVFGGVGMILLRRRRGSPPDAGSVQGHGNVGKDHVAAPGGLPAVPRATARSVVR